MFSKQAFGHADKAAQAARRGRWCTIAVRRCLWRSKNRIQNSLELWWNFGFHELNYGALRFLRLIRAEAPLFQQLRNFTHGVFPPFGHPAVSN
jgi:hypothetical protein